MAVVTETFTAEDINAVAKENRRFAYTQESDPLFMEVQRGDATMEEYQAKVQEIKDRFPYVTEDQQREVTYPDPVEPSEDEDIMATYAANP